MEISPLQDARRTYKPKLPPALRQSLKNIIIDFGETTEAQSDQGGLKQAFPNTYGAPVARFRTSESAHELGKLNVGVVLSGGQAPGGHNVIIGLLDALKSAQGKQEKKAIEEKMRTEIHDAVDNAGITVEQYRKVNEAMSENPKLRQRILQLVEKMRGSS